MSLRRVSWGWRVSEAASAAIDFAADWQCLPPLNFLIELGGEVAGTGLMYGRLKMGWNVGVNVEREMGMRMRRDAKWGLIILNETTELFLLQ